MILHGDEVGRTQGGNNNVYCQDNETSWVDWAAVDEELLAFTQELMRLRTEHPVFRRRRFFTGETAANGLPDIAWLAADGTPMGEDDWSLPTVQPLVVFLNGEGIAEPGRARRGDRRRRSSWSLLNPTHEDASITLPPARFGTIVERRADHRRARRGRPCEAGSQLAIGARSLVVLRHD